MRHFLAAAVLGCLFSGCAPQTTMRCEPAAFAGFYCEPGAYLSRSAIEAVCAGPAICQDDGTVLCGSNSPTGGNPYQIHCANGQPSR